MDQWLRLVSQGHDLQVMGLDCSWVEREVRSTFVYVLLKQKKHQTRSVCLVLTRFMPSVGIISSCSKYRLFPSRHCYQQLTCNDLKVLSKSKEHNVY